jgi:hypothetical protein
VSVSADSLDKLSTKIEEAKRSIQDAVSASEVEVKSKVETARKRADERAAAFGAKGQAAADESNAHWKRIQTDWERHRQDVRRRIDEAEANEDLEVAETRAEWAEADARDAVAFASNAIDEATYAMLDAILASKDVKVLLDSRA